MRTCLGLLAVVLVLSAGEGAVVPTSLQAPLTSEQNPYLDIVVRGFRADLAKLAASTSDVTDAERRGASRDETDELRATLWLLVNPASPLRGQESVRDQLRKRTVAYVQSLRAANSDLHASAFDAFALATGIPALVEVRQVVPDLDPTASDAWDAELGRIAEVLWAGHRATPSRWINVDLALAVVFDALGGYLHRPELQAKARAWAEGAATAVYPDGGLAYLGHQNECAHYHDADCCYLARLALQTGDQWYRDVLIRTAWFGPVTSGRCSEFWTVPSWKAVWSGTGEAFGTEAVVTLADLPVLTGMRDRNLREHLAKRDLERHWAKVLDSLMWYRRDLRPAQDLPDHYTAPDRNIVGPRAWHGRFSYAANVRPIPLDEPGLPTLMGVQVTTPAGTRGQFTRSLMPRVLLADAGDEGEGIWSPRAMASAWLTHGLRASQVLGRTWSVVAGTYALHRPASSSRGAITAWTGRQLWIGLPDRVVGVLEVAGPAGTTGLALETVLALGSTTPTTLQALDQDHYRYGDLAVVVHGTDLPQRQALATPFRTSKFPFAELRFHEDLGGIATKAVLRRVLVELRPAWITDDAQVVVSDLDVATVRLHVQAGGRTVDAWYRNGSGATDVALPTVPTNATLHRPDLAPITAPTGLVRLEAEQVMALVCSATPDDHHPGWNSLAQMLAESLAGPAGGTQVNAPPR